MRKLILISAFVLASAAAAQAGQTTNQDRGLVMAANDTPVQAVETSAPTAPAPQAQAQPAPAPAPVQAQAPAPAQEQAQPAQTQPAQAQAAPADAPKQHVAAKPVKKARRNWEGDEAKARRIAARYGVYW